VSQPSHVQDEMQLCTSFSLVEMKSLVTSSGGALFECIFIDLLRPALILCKALQDAEICVYQAIESVMKMKKALDKLKTTPLKE